MHTAMCLLISFIVLGSLVLSSVGMFLPSDEHLLWSVFDANRSLWNASAMLACCMFFAMSFSLIDNLDEENSFFDFTIFPFVSFLTLAMLAPPLASRGQFNTLRIAIVLMAVMAWVLLDCSVMLFGWVSVSFGVGWLALHCSAVAFVLGRASLC